MALQIYHNGRYYNNAFYKQKEVLQVALKDSDKRAKWEKQKFDASAYFQDICTNREFVKEVTRRINAFSMIFTNLRDKKEDEIFQCEVFDGNEAWIGLDNVEYRYFTRKSPKHVAIGYTIIDFLLAFYTDYDVHSGYSFLMTRRELVNLLNVSYDEADWEKAEEKKYENNLCLLREIISKEGKEKYPNLYQEIKDDLFAIEKLLKSGNRFINPKNKDKNGYANFVFYPNNCGLSKKEFERLIKKLNRLGLIVVESKDQTYFDKISNSNVTRELSFLSFPPFSIEFFKKVDKRLGTKRKNANLV